MKHLKTISIIFSFCIAVLLMYAHAVAQNSAQFTVGADVVESPVDTEDLEDQHTLRRYYVTFTSDGVKMITFE